MINFIRFLMLLVFRRGFFKKVKDIKAFDTLSKVEKDSILLERKAKLINFCFENNKFYKEKILSNGYDFYVNKDDLKAAYKDDSLISPPYIGKSSNHIDYTTGSTGQPFKVIKNRSAYIRHYAAYKKAYDYYGLNLGDRWVRLWRGEVKKGLKTILKEISTGRYDITIYDPENPKDTHLNEDRISSIYQEIKKVSPKVVEGYPSALYEISLFMIKNNLLIENVCAVVTGAENLLVNQRISIERAFKCSVYDRYGGTELGLVAHQCVNKIYHVTDSNLTYEVLSKNDLGIGELVITDLYNYAMPLINYRTGDMVQDIGYVDCKCGVSSYAFKSVEGRMNECFRLKSGSIVSSHIWHNIFKKYELIISYQVIQKTISSFEVRLVLSDHNMNLSVLQQKIEQILEEPDSLEIVKVDRIIPGKGGKYSQCLSYI